MNSTCEDIKEFLWQNTSDLTSIPQTMSIFGVLYSIVITLGICGNTFVILSVLRHRSLQSVRNCFIVRCVLPSSNCKPARYVPLLQPFLLGHSSLLRLWLNYTNYRLHKSVVVWSGALSLGASHSSMTFFRPSISRLSQRQRNFFRVSACVSQR